LLVLAAAGAISMVAPFAAAQDSQANDQSAPQEANGAITTVTDPAKRTAELTKQLNSPPTSKEKVLSALQSEHSQMESLHQDTSLSQQIATLRW